MRSGVSSRGFGASRGRASPAGLRKRGCGSAVRQQGGSGLAEGRLRPGCLGTSPASRDVRHRRRRTWGAPLVARGGCSGARLRGLPGGEGTVDPAALGYAGRSWGREGAPRVREETRDFGQDAIERFNVDRLRRGIFFYILLVCVLIVNRI